LQMDFNTSVPIYLQIITAFKRRIATGSLGPGDRLPSQRDLAIDLKVNANTVQRAYREMENLGLVETLRGQGTFVCSREDLRNEIRGEMLSQLVRDFVRAMHSLGCSEKTAVELVQKRFGEVNEDD